MKALRLFSSALLLPLVAASCSDLATAPAREAPSDGAQKYVTGTLWVNCPAVLTVGQGGSCSATFNGFFVSAMWYSSNPAVASVSGGFVVARAPGVASISGSYNGQTSRSTIQVVAPPQPSVTTRVTVSAATVSVGGSAQLVLKVYDQYGKTMTGRPVTWSIDNPGIATIGAGGMVTGQTIGSTTARATVDGVAGAGTVTVQAEQEVPDNPMCGNVYC